MYFPSCTNPISIFLDKKAHRDPVQVPCGKCIACRISSASSWALRCQMEYRSCDQTGFFLTLTYDDDHLPLFVSKRDLQLFFKRMRKVFKFRYFACGEYGSATMRPHYHILVFGVDTDAFLQFVKHKQFCFNGVRGISVFWDYGFCHVGNISEQSCQYVAKYCLKQVRSQDKSHLPFRLMSRRPALGHAYMLKHYRRILDDRDPLCSSRSVDPNSVSTLPRMVRARCEEIEFYDSDFDPAVSELQSIRKDRRIAFANKLFVEKFGSDFVDSRRSDLDSRIQRNFNLLSMTKRSDSV